MKWTGGLLTCDKNELKHLLVTTYHSDILSQLFREMDYSKRPFIAKVGVAKKVYSPSEIKSSLDVFSVKSTLGSTKSYIPLGGVQSKNSHFFLHPASDFLHDICVRPAPSVGHVGHRAINH